MHPIDFPEKNFVFTKPVDMTDEQCSDLPVWRGLVDIDGKGNQAPAIISCWQLSEQDIEEIKRTGLVYLSITGNGMPPVSVFTGNPFAKELV